MGRHELVVEAKVRATPKTVWGVLTDPRRYATWMAHLDRVDVQTRGALHVGSLLKFTARFGSHLVVSEVEVVAADAPQRLAWKHLYDVLDGKPFTLATDGLTEFEVEAAHGHTLLRNRVSFIGHGLKAAIGANYFLHHKVKPEVEHALAKFRGLCE